MADRNMEQGEIVTVEFDRSIAQLGRDLIEAGLLEGELGQVARVLPSAERLDADFSAGSLLAEFVVSVAGGVSSGVLVELIKARLLQPKQGLPPASVQQLTSGPGDPSIHLRVSVEVCDDGADRRAPD